MKHCKMTTIFLFKHWFATNTEKKKGVKQKHECLFITIRNHLIKQSHHNA